MLTPKRTLLRKNTIHHLNPPRGLTWWARIR